LFVNWPSINRYLIGLRSNFKKKENEAVLGWRNENLRLWQVLEREKYQLVKVLLVVLLY
jgi:hypothetical protein